MASSAGAVSVVRVELEPPTADQLDDVAPGATDARRVNRTVHPTRVANSFDQQAGYGVEPGAGL